MRIVLDYDDFSDHGAENCISQLESIVKEVPEIKINLFTIPALHGQPIGDPSWIGRVETLIYSKNIELCVHGLWHTHLEFADLTKEQAFVRLSAAADVFEDLELPTLPVFKAPNWGININTYHALEEMGYTHIYSHPDFRHLEDMAQSSVKTVIYNWNLKDNPPDEELIIAHGHTHNVCDNGIDQTRDKIIKFAHSNDIQWLFANEV